MERWRRRLLHKAEPPVFVKGWVVVVIGVLAGALVFFIGLAAGQLVSSADLL